MLRSYILASSRSIWEPTYQYRAYCWNLSDYLIFALDFEIPF